MSEQLLPIPVPDGGHRYSDGIRQRIKEGFTPCYSLRGTAVLVAPIGKNGCAVVRIRLAVAGEPKALGDALNHIGTKGNRALFVSEDVSLRPGGSVQIDLSRTWAGYSIEATKSDEKDVKKSSLSGFLVNQIVMTVDFFTPTLNNVFVNKPAGVGTERHGWKANDPTPKVTKWETLREGAIPTELLEAYAERCEPLEEVKGTRDLLAQGGYHRGFVEKKKRRAIKL